MEIKNIENHEREVTALLKGMANESRLRILCALCVGEKCVGELENITNLSQSALSQHLSKLRHSGIVQTRRKAQTIYYSTNHPGLRQVIQSLCNSYNY